MRIFPPLALVLAASAGRPAWGAPPSAAAGLRAASARIADFIGRELPQAGARSPLPAEPASLAPAALAAQGAGAPLLPARLWDSLPVPDARTLAGLATRIPGLDTGKVRELTPEAIDQVLGEAVTRGYAAIDLFSDDGLRTDRVYYAPQQTLAQAFSKYLMRAITLISGRSDDGTPFHMQALVMGSGRVEMLYDQDQFTFDNPLCEGSYTLRSRVSHVVQAPGDLLVEGVVANVSLLHARVRRFVKISKDQVRVETSLGSRDKPLFPIRLR